MQPGQRSARTIPSRIIATCFALVSFAAASVVGVAVGNQASTIVWRATVVMVLGWVVGRAIGAIAQHTVDDHIEAYRKQNPVPEPGAVPAPTGESPAAGRAA